MEEKEVSFTLLRWLKVQREKEEAYQQKRAEIRCKEDNEYYVKYLAFIVVSGKYNKREGVMLFSLVKWNQEGRNFTDGQRSLIGGLYAKYVLAKD
jgi:hypothetical protein